MKVGVWTEYRWECSRCCEVNSLSYMPDMNGTLICQHCGQRDKVDAITEDYRPAPKTKRAKT